MALNFVTRRQKELKMSNMWKYLANKMVLSQTETMYSRETNISVSVLGLIAWINCEPGD